jgi:mRNA interferase MazF
MGKFVKGDIVIVPFPFSDLSSNKKRPAMVIADLKGDDVILCQITSQTNKDKYSILIKDSEFSSGQLIKESYIRPNRLFTADKNIILYKTATLKNFKIQEVIIKLISIIKN